MKKIVILLVVALCMSSTFALADGNVNFLLGTKYLDDDYAPVDEQTEFGIEADFCKDGSISASCITVGFLNSTASEDVVYTLDYYHYYFGNLTVNTRELYVGFKEVWTIAEHLHPYIGAGLALVFADIDLDGITDESVNIGTYAAGGIYYTFDNNMNIGLNLRYSEADVEMFDSEFKAGGLHTSLMFGYHF